MKLYAKKPGFDVIPALAVLTAIAMAAAFYLIFAYAPVERTMGVVQKIFYFHVPSAIAAYMGFFVCLVGSVMYLLRRDAKWDVVAQSGAELGVLFCAFVLISGPLWARKAWGTFWTGEPRLMLTLVLFLVFVAYLLVRNFGGRGELTRKICALLAILGVADIPLVRYAVVRWRGNHPRVITGEGEGITPEMQVALLGAFIATALLFTTLLILRNRVGYAQEDAETYYRAVSARGHRADDLEQGAPAV